MIAVVISDVVEVPPRSGCALSFDQDTLDGADNRVLPLDVSRWASIMPTATVTQRDWPHFARRYRGLNHGPAQTSMGTSAQD